MRRTPGSLETRVMQVLWAAGEPVLGRRVWEQVRETDGSARTTVLTVLARLEAKGRVVRHPDGGFEAVSTEAGEAAANMHRLLARSADRSAALAHFAHMLSAADVVALRDALRDRAKHLVEVAADDATACGCGAEHAT